MIENMKVRRFKEEDAQEVRNLIVRNFLEVNSKDYGISAMEKLAKAYNAEKVLNVASYAHMYVFEFDGKIIGTGSISSFWGSETESIPIDGYHLVVHVWIRNSKGEYLISQRSANRPTYPLMWECVGGSVVKGEDSLQGAIREAKEEVGVDLIPKSGQVLFTKTRKIIDGKIFNDIMDVWLFEYDGEVDLGNATTDEVAQVAWMNREQIKELFDANMFVDTLEYFFTEVDK